jgi:predicted metallopeptidase
MGKGKQTKAVPTQYDWAETVEELAKELIPKHHSHLVNCKIAYLYKNKEMKSKGRKVVATAEKISAKNHKLSGYHFLITVAYPTYNELSDAQKRAIIDHELEHCFVEDDEQTGEPKYKLLPHDVEEFGSIIMRHGLYTTSLVKLGRVVGNVGSKSTEIDPVEAAIRKADEEFISTRDL